MDFEDWAGRELTLLSGGLAHRPVNAHQSIFKYIGLNSETSWTFFGDMLNKLELVGSSAQALNDPFELSPHVFDDLRPKVIHSALGIIPLSPLDYRLRGQPIPSVDETYSDLEPYREEAKEFLNLRVQNSRIICFCERSDSPLLWSHYANSYRGACLHFLGRGFKGYTPFYVSYSAHRPTLPLSLALRVSHSSKKASLRSVYEFELEKMQFFCKASDWEYECEMRIIYDMSKRPAVNFLEEGLVSIILGPRMSSVDEERLRDLVSQSRLAHLPIRRARLSTNSFSVEID
ncbi:DUF2971 domain-containing protein [Phyllobacterium sp. 628]|uniref:DUF2971 domain-containing protein n=1 Tax=Phyllobacterium sp. 628 TaxID=2718938 RepID=UPI00166240B9|nr:DUF2971 domain-containing protein [Phyllobacterium sp. 628]QND52795.1 DUF2971 domain-containing protein [Phyllobacterium sp. 628]